MKFDDLIEGRIYSYYDGPACVCNFLQVLKKTGEYVFCISYCDKYDVISLDYFNKKDTPELYEVTTPEDIKYCLSVFDNIEEYQYQMYYSDGSYFKSIVKQYVR
jgi:hypothetical protein